MLAFNKESPRVCCRLPQQQLIESCYSAKDVINNMWKLLSIDFIFSNVLVYYAYISKLFFYTYIL